MRTSSPNDLVILTVLNRVLSEEFPDNTHDVIFEKSNGVYQFSCIGMADGMPWNRRGLL